MSNLMSEAEASRRTLGHPVRRGRARAQTVIVVAALLASAVSVHLHAGPATAKVFQIIPADETETPVDTLSSNQALFAIGTTDLLGAVICVVGGSTVLDPNGALSCDGGGAWGKATSIIGEGTFITPIEGPPLWPGTWKLLADGGHFPGVDALSIPFTVTACPGCSNVAAKAVIDGWKAAAEAMEKPVNDICNGFEFLSAIGVATAAGGVVKEGISGGLAFSAEFAVASVEFAFAYFDLPETTEEWALKLGSHVACRTEAMYEDIAHDPPDPDYLTVAQPVFAVLPTTPDAAANALVDAYDRVHAYGRAQLTAFERYQEALTDGSDAAVKLQCQAVATFGAQLVHAMRDAAASSREYGDALAADATLNDPVLTTARLQDAQAIRTRVTSDGFTPGELQQLQDAGLSAGDIALVQAAFARDVSQAPVDVSIKAILDAGASAFEAAIPAVDLFDREFAVVAAVNHPPVASFTAAPLSGATPLEVSFADGSTDPDNDPLTYHWTFDDGTTSIEASPVHTFTDVRSYSVRLDVSDGQAGSFASSVVTVTPAGSPPTARFTVPRYTYLVGDTIHLTDESTDVEGPIASRFWSDPYGIFSEHSASETDFTFTSAVPSKIRLDVTDSDGWTASYERAVTAFTDLPIPSRGGCEGPAADSAPDSLGNEFMLAFPGNFQDFPNSLYLFIASDVPTSGFVEVPGLGFEQDFSVTPGTATQVIIPPEAHLTDSDLVTANGIRVCADHEVSVYGDNQRGASTDAYLGLPTDVLGAEYVVMSYPADVPDFEGERSQLDFVGIADGTNVHVTPSIDVGGHPAGVPFTVDLGRFMTYQLKADLGGQDLTGTIIHADHPIGVFGGASCTDVPAGVAACDHMVEQLAPTRTWGTDFSIVSLAGRTGGDLVRVLASQSGTQVVLDGSVAATLGQGQFVELDLASASTHEIQTSKPSLVAQFGKSLGADGATGDPFMAMVSPNEQFADHYTMVSLPGFDNYLNLVIQADDVDACALDGASLTGAIQPMGSSPRVGIRQPVDAGTHVVSCPSPFGIQAYGWALFESYGYPGGSRLETITSNRPPIGNPDAYNAPQDGVLTVPTLTGVLANDSDPDGDGLSATKVTDPANGSVDLAANGSFVYTPNAGYTGPDSFTYNVSDGTGTVGPVIVSITVEETNHAPTLASVADLTIPEMVLFNLTLSGADSDGDALAYSVQLGPSGLTVGTTNGILDWTPSEAQGPGDYPVTVRVADPDGLHADRSFTIHVTEVNRAPSLAAIADRTVYPGDPVSLTAVGSDPDLPANTLGYSLESGPTGAAVNATSGAFTWTASSTLGDYGVTIGVSDSAGGTAQRSFTIHVVRDTTTLTLGGDTSGQYSDQTTITATLKVGSTGVSGASVSISLGAASQSATTNASGVASATFTIPGPAGGLATAASFAGTLSKAPSAASGTFTVNLEDSTIVYSGDTVGLAGATLHLAATFTDSAASGFAGSNSETRAGATVGDITRARIAFAVYNAATCLTGSPITTLSAFVTDTGPAGDGIGTATVTWSSSTGGTFCIVPSLVGAAGTGINGYYTAPPAEPAGLAVFIDTAGKVTGGGWVAIANGRGNFGFNATSTGTKVRGNFVFIERTVYRGTKAMLIIKSNAIESLRTSGSIFPITATLMGKASFKYISSLDGSTLYESGNATFTATVIDTGVKGPPTGDSLAIRAFDKAGAVIVDLASTPLGGGNIVAHLK